MRPTALKKGDKVFASIDLDIVVTYLLLVNASKLISSLILPTLILGPFSKPE